MKALRIFVAGALASAASACTLPRPYGDTVDLHTLFAGGYRSVQHEAFDGHRAYALALTTCDPANGWGYELGASYGTEDGEDGARPVSGEFDDFSFGLRRTFGTDDDRARPYLGFGGSLMRLERSLEAPTAEADDHGAGPYVCAGVLWSLGRIGYGSGAEVVLGMDLRALSGEDYDYEQLTLVLGFGK